MGGHHFFAPAKLIFFTESRSFAHSFIPASARPFFSWLFAPYFHHGRSLRSRFFRCVFLALRFWYSTVWPASQVDFFPRYSAAVFFVALRATFFLRPLHGRFFRDISGSRQSRVYPASKLAALRPTIFARLLRPLCITVWLCFAASPVSYPFF